MSKKNVPAKVAGQEVQTHFTFSYAMTVIWGRISQYLGYMTTKHKWLFISSVTLVGVLGAIILIYLGLKPEDKLTESGHIPSWFVYSWLILGVFSAICWGWLIMRTNKDIRLADAEAERKRQILLNQKRCRELFSGFSFPEAFLAAQHLQVISARAIEELEKGMRKVDVSRSAFSSFMLDRKVQGFFSEDGSDFSGQRQAFTAYLSKKLNLSAFIMKELQGYPLESGETAHVQAGYLIFFKGNGVPAFVKIVFMHGRPSGMLYDYNKKEGKKTAKLNAEQLEFLGVKNPDDCHHFYKHNAQMIISVYNAKNDPDEVVQDLKQAVAPKIKAYKARQAVKSAQKAEEAPKQKPNPIKPDAEPSNDEVAPADDNVIKMKEA